MRRHLLYGFLPGFAFGVAGMWILAALSLVFQPIEMVSGPLFWFGRWLATFIEHEGSVGTAGTVLLFAANGVLYGLIGMAIHATVTAARGR